MRSQLGREVAKRGDFNTIVRDFDDEKCRFRCDNFEWYNDWILLKHYGGNALEGTFTWILQPANALQEIQVKRDEDEDDQYILFISVKTYGRTFKVYVSGDELKSLPQL